MNRNQAKGHAEETKGKIKAQKDKAEKNRGKDKTVLADVNDSDRRETK